MIIFHKTNALCPKCGERIWVVDNRNNALYCNKCGCHFSDEMRGSFKRYGESAYYLVYIKANRAAYEAKHSRLIDLAYEYNANDLHYSNDEGAIVMGWRNRFPSSITLYKCITLANNMANRFKEGSKIKLKELINKFDFNRDSRVKVFDERGKELDIVEAKHLETISWMFDDYMDCFIDKFWVEDDYLCVQIS